VKRFYLSLIANEETKLRKIVLKLVVHNIADVNLSLLGGLAFIISIVKIVCFKFKERAIQLHMHTQAHTKHCWLT